MAKNIVFCADGTWNNPYNDENSDKRADPTNVYKLFLCLAGRLSISSLCDADEQEKAYTVDGATRQVAKYIHGVGDSRNPINKLMGGAFGAGVISRVVRGYTFISRNYEPGDNIHITGFSRGAYTARALCGLIVSQGLLKPELTRDQEQAYRCGAQAWYRYRSASSHASILASLAEIVSDLPAFLSCKTLKPKDLIPIKKIASVGVWDTVGAMGFPEYEGSKSMDAFKFADSKLSPKVAAGFHAVSLDEQRAVFTPTLWDNADNVTQYLFPGAHADVGGGYNENSLSDIALQWMMENLKGTGMIFADSLPCVLNPDPAGAAHKPWVAAPWTLFPAGPRRFTSGIPAHPSVEERRKAAAVIADPVEPPAPYCPINLPE